jgi:hypothetical protein
MDRIMIGASVAEMTIIVAQTAPAWRVVSRSPYAPLSTLRRGKTPKAVEQCATGFFGKF